MVNGHNEHRPICVLDFYQVSRLLQLKLESTDRDRLANNDQSHRLAMYTRRILQISVTRRAWLSIFRARFAERERHITRL